jgi:GNAT superfamily N-acetyltransferase
MNFAMGSSNPHPGKVEVLRVGDIHRGDYLAIRRRVFIEEQGVPEPLELDGRDGEATAWLAQCAGRPVGTARARRVDAAIKAERVAVLRAFRRRGIGDKLMRALESWAFEQGVDRVVLNAQESAISF